MLFACPRLKRLKRDKHPLRRHHGVLFVITVAALGYQASVVCERRQSIYVFLIIEVCHKRHENCSCSRFAWQSAQGMETAFQLNGRQYPLPLLAPSEDQGYCGQACM